ncbi:MAG: TraB/GumN family protein [Chitinophagaceae bacterium]
MKYVSSFLLFSLSLLSACSQKTSNATKEKSANEEIENSLLWKISGNGLTKPSYLFGTMHMLCAEDAMLSNNLKKAIAECDEVYLEVDMDNMMEMFGALGKMKMRGDTTLEDLLFEI